MPIGRARTSAMYRSCFTTCGPHETASLQKATREVCLTSGDPIKSGAVPIRRIRRLSGDS